MISVEGEERSDKCLNTWDGCRAQGVGVVCYA